MHKSKNLHLDKNIQTVQIIVQKYSKLYKEQKLTVDKNRLEWKKALL